MKAQKKKQAIIETGMRLFLDRGYHNVSVEDICKENGITKPTFYKYVPAKELILVHFYEQQMKQAAEYADELLKTGHAVAAIQTLLGSLPRAAVYTGPELYRVYWNYLLKNSAAPRRSVENTHSIIEESITTLQSQQLIGTREDPKKLTIILLDISEGLGLSWAACQGAFDLETSFQKSVKSVLNVLITPEMYYSRQS